MQKFYSIFLVVFVLSGCATSQKGINYNPSKVSDDALATVGSLPKPQAQALTNPGVYQIDLVNGVPVTKQREKFNGFEAGVHILGWSEVEFVNKEKVTHASGLMVANFSAGGRYTLGVRPNRDDVVEIWDSNILITVSKSCVPSTCDAIKAEMEN